MWKMGPECAAQHSMKVKPSTRNCGEVSAAPTVVLVGGGRGVEGGAARGSRRTRTSSAAGSSSTQASTPMSNIAARQP